MPQRKRKPVLQREHEAVAASLDKALRAEYNWVQAVGAGTVEGRMVLYVYTIPRSLETYVRAEKRVLLADICKNGWLGYPVIVKPVGKVSTA